jgi:ABC-2 type transport system ATP-binding protein
VGERLADGGTVLFVDHDPARLAGLVDERWQLAGGTVSVIVGDIETGRGVTAPAKALP